METLVAIVVLIMGEPSEPPVLVGTPVLTRGADCAANRDLVQETLPDGQEAMCAGADALIYMLQYLERIDQ